VARNNPRLTNVKKVKIFMRLCNFFRKSVTNYSDKPDELTKLLRTDSTFAWEQQQQNALNNPPFDGISNFFSKPF